MSKSAWAVAADILDPPEWKPEGRPELELHQIPPDGYWTLWLLEAGRGAGKTEACSRYFARYMRKYPGSRGRIIAPTYGDAVESCITGPSGLLAIDPECVWVPNDPGGSKIKWPNGSEALVIGTPFPKDVDRLRAGGNRNIDWWEEMAANKQLKSAWAQAELGLRMGKHPHSIGSSTPRATKEYMEIRDGEGVVLTHATIDDNPHLNEDWKSRVKNRYKGTRLGQQELEGKLLTDIPGALWTRSKIDNGRVKSHPTLVRVVVSVDPAASANPESDDTGIIVLGMGTDGHVYVLDDYTCHLSPDGWGDRVVTGYSAWQGDLVVGERNNGGDMVEHVIRSIEPRIPFKSVWASRGKATRAEPVATLYGTEDREPLVHHVGSLPELEDQLCIWVPGDGKSPDRLDALVWGVWELLVEPTKHQETIEDYDPVRIGPQI